MTTAVSLITGFPEETDADLADTVDFFVNALRHENAQPQLHILAPLADTPIHREYRDRLVFDDVISDMSHQGWEQDAADRDLILAHPNIFPHFYGVPTLLDREYVKRARAFLLNGSQMMRLLYVALHQECGHLLDVLDRFERWRDEKGIGDDDPVGYFRQVQFTEDFLAFVRDRIVPGSPVAAALSSLSAYTAAFQDVRVEDPSTDLEQVTNGQILRSAFIADSVPALADNVRLLDVEVDFNVLMDRLSTGLRLEGLEVRPHRLASRKLPGQWPEVLQLSAASTVLLELCDGRSAVKDIAPRAQRALPSWAGIPAENLCVVGLELLRHDGLVVDARQSLDAEALS
jgi:hypothetical protein